MTKALLIAAAAAFALAACGEDASKKGPATSSTPSSSPSTPPAGAGSGATTPPSSPSSSPDMKKEKDPTKK
jgi:hypothetical protein